MDCTKCLNKDNTMKKIAVVLAACAALFACAPKNEITLFPAADFETEVDGKQVGL